MARARFFDGRSAQARPVEAMLQGGTLVVRNAAGDLLVSWPASDVAAQPAPDGSLTLRHGRDDARLIVDDPALAAALRPVVRRWARSDPGWRVAAAVAAALLTAAILLVAVIPGALAPLIPLRWEASLGASAQAMLASGHGRCDGPDGQRALERLASALNGTGGPIQLTVLDDPAVNAFALPGNRVVVLRGLIAEASDGDELAGVLAHEMGHLAHRDPTRQLLRSLGLSVLAAGLGWTGPNLDQVATTLIALSYSRSVEADADAYAVDALRRAGLRADGLGRFLAGGRGGGGLAGFLSDHPATADRIRNTARSSIGADAFTAAEWDDVRHMCPDRSPAQ